MVERGNIKGETAPIIQQVKALGVAGAKLAALEKSESKLLIVLITPSYGKRRKGFLFI